jgi:signal transduction histidine kinase
VFNADGIVTEFYSKTPIVPDFSIDKHLGKSIPEIFVPTIVKKISDLVRATLENDVTTSFEYPMNGRWYSAKLSPHEDGEQAVMVLRDVSDLKQAEEEARQAHGVAMLYQDITGHDIRNLLQAILIASDLLQADETDQAKTRLIHHVTEAVTEASSLITSVQSTAALLSTPLEKTSLDFTLKSCTQMFHNEHQDVDIESHLGVSDAVVNADRFLCHMLMNVFSNAVKHNNQNEKKVWTRLIEVDDGYELTIADNGPGIKDTLKKNLISPERRSGGVGILQCIQIAKKYGGAFEIHDRVTGAPEKGAKFRVWLPKVRA